MKSRVLYICGSINQTKQLDAVARALGHHDAWFSPYYGDRVLDTMRRMGLVEMSIAGNKRRTWAIDWLRARRRAIDVGGRRGPYDLVVTCSDVVVPKNIRRGPVVVVQEGILDPDRWLAWIARRAGLPLWVAGTALTGESGRYDRICVASDGYREQFVARGVDPRKIVVTGIPNFDDCASYRENDFPLRGYVLAATSDTRETWKLVDRREAFIRKVLRIAAGREIVFKLHPNENAEREQARIWRLAPGARVFQDGSAEEMVANAACLVTEWSSLAFLGLTLGKEVHSNWPIEQLRRLCPIQNGGTSAGHIAAVCRELLGEAPRVHHEVLQEASP